MSIELWQSLMVTVIGGIIVYVVIMFILIKQHTVYSYLKKNRPNNYFSNVEVPDEIPIDRLTNIFGNVLWKP